MYIWQIEVVTNLGNKKLIEIREESEKIDIARINAISRILNVSRYGIPCYNFEFGNNYYLAPMQRINIFKEYYEISNYFIDKINSQTPIKFYNYKNLELNVNARPFIPIL